MDEEQEYEAVSTCPFCTASGHYMTQEYAYTTIPPMGLRYIITCVAKSCGVKMEGRSREEVYEKWHTRHGKKRQVL